MKNILFVIDTLRMGGAEKSLISLLRTLDPKKVNVDLYLFEQGDVLQSQVPNWVHILDSSVVTRGMTLELKKYLLPVIKKGHVFAAFARLKMSFMGKFSKREYLNWDLIKKYIPKLDKEYDVAIGYLEGFPDFFVLDKVNAKKKIGWIHIDYTGRDLNRKEKEMYQKFDEIVTISDICKNAFIEKIPQIKDRISILENIVIPDEVIEKSEEKISEKWNEDLINIVSVGRLDYQKGMDIGAQAAKILKQNNVPFCWHVYGKGVMKDDIDEYVKEEGLEDCFILEGLRPNPYPYMKKADIIVQPSRWEGKSIVLDEAKILGKAIVVTSYPSVNDQIIHRKTGIITAIDPKNIAEGIELLIDNSSLKLELERNSRNEENQSYKVVERFYQILE